MPYIKVMNNSHIISLPYSDLFHEDTEPLAQGIKQNPASEEQ